MKKYIKSLPKWAHITGQSALAILVLYLIFRDKVDAFIIEKLIESNSVKLDVDLDKIVKKGSRGIEVKKVQGQLIADGLADVVGIDDGIFGAKTEAALIERFDLKEISLNQYKELAAAEGQSKMNIRPTSQA